MSFSPLLPVHISAGVVGILSGAAPLSFRKGSPRHILAGRVFVIAMLALSASGAIMAMSMGDGPAPRGRNGRFRSPHFPSSQGK